MAARFFGARCNLRLRSLRELRLRLQRALTPLRGTPAVVPINELKAKAEAFGISLTIALHNGSDSIIIPTQRSELKRLLKFLDEDYYESSLTGRKFVSNSKAPVQLQP